jgi:TRAP transporter TAXI family solute receptor
MTARLLLLVLAWLLVGGCGRQPDAQIVQDAIQQQLDAALGGRVLEVQRLQRSGSAPLPQQDGRLVYFDARLKLARDYDFTRWDAHSVASLASVLGAGPKGVFGLQPDGNAAGDLIGVHGTAALVRAGGRWQLVAQTPATPSAAPPLPPAAVTATVRPQPREVPPPTPLQVAMERLQTLVASPERAMPVPAERDEILREELETAYRQASARLARAADVIVLAGGAPGGAYAEAMQALAARAGKSGVALEALSTEGSVSNIRLLNEGRVQFALVQNDIAGAAHAGKGRFAGAPQRDLRAAGVLFPEAVQLVVRTDAGISSVTDLRGKRVQLGPEGSGSRANALAILAAHGVEVETLASAGSASLADAATAVAEERADALFFTGHAPTRELQKLAARAPVSWVPIGPSPDLLEAGLVPLTLPPRTYAGQSAPLPTMTAVTLLVTRTNVGTAQVETMRRLLAEPAQPAEGAAVAQIGRGGASTGLTIPWHAAAAPATGSPAPAAKAAASPPLSTRKETP